MKKLTCLGLAAVMALSLLTGCGGSNPSNSGANTNNTEISGQINLDGSTSMEKVIGILSETFMGDHSGVTITAGGAGSGAGITAAVNGTVDLGMASRELKQGEIDQGAVAHVIALDGVAIVVNKENPVADLTVDQIAKLFTGEITNWSEVGGADAEVAPLGREPGSGTRGAFEEIVGVVDSCQYKSEYSSTGDVIGQVASNPKAIGYASLSAVGDTVKAVQVNGVDCTEDTVKDGSYEIQRPFLLVTKEGAQLTPTAQAFLDYALSAEVAELIAQAGAVAPN